MDIKELSKREQEELIRGARNAYYKEWRNNNTNKNKQIQDRYWLKKALEKKEQDQG